jgi:hypothetical protein
LRPNYNIIHGIYIFLEDRRTGNWSGDECLFLVYGIKTIGFRDWPKILDLCSSRFSDRDVAMIRAKFYNLKSENKLKFFEGLVERHSAIIKHLLLTQTSIGTVVETLLSIDKQNGIYTHSPDTSAWNSSKSS